MREAIQTALPVLPLLLVQLVGIILALVFVRRRTKPALLTLFALLIALGVSATWIGLVPLLIDRFVERGEDVERMLVAVRWSTNLLMALAWALMLAAAFVGRSGRTQYEPGSWDTPTEGEPRYAAHSGPHVEPLSKGFYLGSIFGAFLLQTVLVIPGLLLTQSREESKWMLGLGFVCVGLIPMLYGAVVLLTLIHKLWAAIQGAPARTTPGKAVGFLFIPLFGAYWIFQIYWGWARDYNRLVERANLRAPRVSEGLALTVCILALLSIVPIAGIVIGLFNLGFLTAFLNSAIDGVNALAAGSSEPRHDEAPSGG